MSKAVQSMFATIAGRYDLANDVLSFGVHRVWRKKAVKLAAISEGEEICDICCGTGDFAFASAKAVGKTGRVVALDFVSQMIDLANAKKRPEDINVEFLQGDALCLPFDENIFDATTIGFGIRNVDNPVKGLKEMHRVLKTSGRAVVLEFGQPTVPVFSTIYNFYSKYFMPTIGGILTGNKQAFEYLPETSKAFPAGKKFLALMEEAGFSETRVEPLFGGVAYIYIGTKS